MVEHLVQYEEALRREVLLNIERLQVAWVAGWRARVGCTSRELHLRCMQTQPHPHCHTESSDLTRPTPAPGPS